MYKIFAGYRYDRIKKDLVPVNINGKIEKQEKEVQFASYSGDVFEFDRDIKTLEDND